MLSVNVITLIIFSSLMVFIKSHGTSMIGPGRWRVLSVEACEGDFPARVAISRRKCNRTHDGFNLQIQYDDVIDEDNYAVQLDICKHVDGGCKPYQTLADDSLARFLYRYANDNVRAFLELANVEPPTFPVPGNMAVEGFVFDYGELPRDCIYGSFGGVARMLRDGQTVACVRLDADFSEDHDDR